MNIGSEVLLVETLAVWDADGVLYLIVVNSLDLVCNSELVPVSYIGFCNRLQSVIVSSSDLKFSIEWVIVSCTGLC